jgi:hypothetical protein
MNIHCPTVTLPLADKNVVPSVCCVVVQDALVVHWPASGTDVLTSSTLMDRYSAFGMPADTASCTPLVGSMPRRKRKVVGEPYGFATGSASTRTITAAEKPAALPSATLPKLAFWPPDSTNAPCAAE